MIKSIRLKNFRSILDGEIRFSDSGLTVLVGANGSGKTNIVRGLEFISLMHRAGLQHAVVGEGGQRSLLPKSIPGGELRGSETTIRYELQLDTPPDYPPDCRPPAGRHEVRFKTSARNEVTVESEVVRFLRPIAVARALRSPAGTAAELDRKADKNSWIEFRQARGRDFGIVSSPRINRRTSEDFAWWFGLQFLSGTADIATAEDFRTMLDELKKQSERHPTHGHEDALIFERFPVLFSVSNHTQVFLHTAQNIRRFELHVATLRRDQRPKAGGRLFDDGENLPSVVRLLSNQEDSQESWTRILQTLSDVAPYVYSVGNDLLRSGTEYVEFLETKSGRSVESWDASDGTLRALAILVAVESHPPGHTLIIEEPEKGLHPWAVRYLLSHIREAINRRGIQAILTTHSPQVLEAVSPSEVLVAKRTHESGTTVKVAEQIVGNSVSAGELGRLWVKGLLGGYPYDS